VQNQGMPIRRLTDILHVRQQKDLRWIVGPGRREVTEPAGVLVGPRR